MLGRFNANAKAMPLGQNEYVREFFKSFDAHLLAGKTIFKTSMCNAGPVPMQYLPTGKTKNIINNNQPVMQANTMPMQCHLD